MTQSQIVEVDEVAVNYAAFMRDTLNLSPPVVTEEVPHCSYNPPKRSPPLKRKHSSSEDDEALLKTSKLTSVDVRNQDFPKPIDHVAGDSGNEGSESNQIPILNQGRERNKK